MAVNYSKVKGRIFAGTKVFNKEDCSWVAEPYDLSAGGQGLVFTCYGTNEVILFFYAKFRLE